MHEPPAAEVQGQHGSEVHAVTGAEEDLRAQLAAGNLMLAALCKRAGGQLRFEREEIEGLHPKGVLNSVDDGDALVFTYTEPTP